MFRVKEVVVVEGNYDKIKLSSFLDGIIFVIGGFSILHDKNRIETLVTLAKNSGVVFLTDSDSAGFLIRNSLKQHIPTELIKHAYIPEIAGKEKRKQKAGAEGVLGVEGMSEEVIIEALKKSGCTVDGEANAKKCEITKTDLFNLGLTGGRNSASLRAELMKKVDLPSKMSSNMLCSVLSRMMTLEELERLVESIGKDEKNE